MIFEKNREQEQGERNLGRLPSCAVEDINPACAGFISRGIDSSGSRSIMPLPMQPSAVQSSSDLQANEFSSSLRNILAPLMTLTTLLTASCSKPIEPEKVEPKSYSIAVQKALTNQSPYFEVSDLRVAPDRISKATLRAEITYSGNHEVSPGVYFWLVSRDASGNMYPTPLVVNNSSCPLALTSSGTFEVEGGIATVTALSDQLTGYTLAMSLSSKVSATPPGCATNENKDTSEGLFIGNCTVVLEPVGP